MTQDERKGLILCLKIEFSDGLGGDQATEDYEPTWDTYSNHTVAHAEK